MPKLRLPGGYRPEDGKGPGDTVKALVTIKIGENGIDGEILDIDGAVFEGYEDKAEKPEPKEEKEEEYDTSSEAFGSRLMSAMHRKNGGDDDMVMG